MNNRKKLPGRGLHLSMNRRQFVGWAGVCGLFMAAPVFAQQSIDLFKLLDPKGENKDLQKAREILQGTGKIMSSSTELDYRSEFAIGQSLAMEGFRRYGLPVENPGLQRYVNFVGRAVARHSLRSGIPFYFVVVESSVYNAFSCPGGIIFISSSLVKEMADEAELACVLAHETAHVGHKHALKTLQRAQFFQGVTQITTATMKGEDGKKFKAMIDDLQTTLFDRGLDKNMEFEADLSGMEIAFRTGYDPGGFIRVLQMLHRRESAARKQGSWYATHPPLYMRLQRCNERMGHYPDAAQLARSANRFDQYRRQL